jgi:hypothetical protein
MEERLIEIIDYILNIATEKDIIAIKSALKRREARSLSPSGKSLGDMATGMASSMGERLKLPIDNLRNTVRDMVARIIRENAPEISEKDVNALLSEWVPESEKRKKASSTVPPDAILSMLKSFIQYSLNAMSTLDDMKLREQIPDWPERYWNAFPDSVQKLVSLYLKGKLDERVFWQEVFSTLGVES